MPLKSTLFMAPSEFDWNRPAPGFGDACMSNEDFMSACVNSGGGTGGSQNCSPYDSECVAAAADQVGACAAAFTSQPGNCHAEGTSVQYSNGTVTEIAPGGKISTANANTAPATAYGAGYDVNGQPLSSFTDSGLSPIVVSSAAPPANYPYTPPAQPSGTPAAPSGSQVTQSAAPPSGTQSATTPAGTPATSSGFDFSSIPWYAWAGAAAVLLLMVTKK